MSADRIHDKTIIAGQTGYGVPLVVAVTGHRDLVPAEEPGIRQRVRDFLGTLKQQYPDRGVTLLSGLAEGADQLVAEEALALDLPLIGVLPMPRDLYVDDFVTPEARAKFDLLCADASEILELPVLADSTAEAVQENEDERARQYAQLGVFLCAHCHILLALWDGKYSNRLGGTGEVVRFHHDDVMPGYTHTSAISRLSLAEDESDLVYHIVCSRNRDDGDPAEGLQPLQVSWFTSDIDTPRTDKIPVRHRRVFEHTNEFSADARKFEERIREEAYPLLEESDRGKMHPGIWDIDKVFCIADWLAIHYQKRVLFALEATHVLALLMGLMYIAYSDVIPLRGFIIAFVLFFLAAVTVHKIGARQGWHRRFLDYRALAEGLRIQYYWAVAGVSAKSGTKYTHDNFLQAQDPDLGWIRNVMRVAGMECNANPVATTAGLDYTIREWIGDNKSGQLGYYARKADEKSTRQRKTDKFANVVMWLGFAAVAMFMFATGDIAERARDPVVIMMGVLLLAVGIRQSYSFAMADNELMKQYQFMYRAFSRARLRIDQAQTNTERRQVLKVLGDAALEEHAEWILLHRERSMDEGEIFRMTG